MSLSRRLGLLLVLAWGAVRAQEPSVEAELSRLRAELYGLGWPVERVEAAVDARRAELGAAAVPAGEVSEDGEPGVSAGPEGESADLAWIEGWFLGLSEDACARLLDSDGIERPFPLRAPRGAVVRASRLLSKTLRDLERGDRVSFGYFPGEDGFLCDCRLLAPRALSVVRGRVEGCVGGCMRVASPSGGVEVLLPEGQGLGRLPERLREIEAGDDLLLEVWEGEGRFSLYALRWEGLGPVKAGRVREDLARLRDEVTAREGAGESCAGSALDTTRRLARSLAPWSPASASAIVELAPQAGGTVSFLRQAEHLQSLLGGRATPSTAPPVVEAAPARPDRPAGGDVVAAQVERVRGWYLGCDGQRLSIAAEGGREAAIGARPDLVSRLAWMVPGDRVEVEIQGGVAYGCTRLADVRYVSLRARVVDAEPGDRLPRLRELPAGRTYALHAGVDLGPLAALDLGDEVFLEVFLAGDRLVATCFRGFAQIAEPKKDYIRNVLRTRLTEIQLQVESLYGDAQALHAFCENPAQSATLSMIESTLAAWAPAGPEFLRGICRRERNAEMVGFLPAGLQPEVRSRFYVEVNFFLRRMEEYPAIRIPLGPAGGGGGTVGGSGGGYPSPDMGGR